MSVLEYLSILEICQWSSDAVVTGSGQKPFKFQPDFDARFVVGFALEARPSVKRTWSDLTGSRQRPLKVDLGIDLSWKLGSVSNEPGVT